MIRPLSTGTQTGSGGRISHPSEPLRSYSAVGWCLSVCIICCIFEGAGRKWVFPNADRTVQAVFYFLKDIPLCLAFLLSLRERATAPIQHVLRQVVAMGTGLVVLATVISIGGMAPIGGVLSGRALLFLPWAVLIIAPALKGRRDHELIMHTLGICIIINAVLGVLQFSLPESHILNRRVSDDMAAVGTLGRIRAFGTFAYIGGMNDLCNLGFWLGAVFISRSPSNVYGYIYVVSGLTIGLAIMTRGGLLTGVTIFMLSMLATRGGRQGLLVILAAMAVALIFATTDDEAANDAEDKVALHEAVFVRAERSRDSVDSRVGGVVFQMFCAMTEVPIGVGLGSAQSSQRMTDSSMSASTQNQYEGEPGRIVVEIGILGLLGAMILRLGIPIVLWQRIPVSLRIDAYPWQALWWPTVWIGMTSVIMMIVFNHIMATLLTIVYILAINGHERQSQYFRNRMLGRMLQ